jgi:hypothetical protein
MCVGPSVLLGLVSESLVKRWSVHDSRLPQQMLVATNVAFQFAKERNTCWLTKDRTRAMGKLFFSRWRLCHMDMAYDSVAVDTLQLRTTLAAILCDSGNMIEQLGWSNSAHGSSR